MKKNNAKTVETVQVFNYGENTPVRVRVMNGQTWFVAKDVCKVLGISNHKDAVSRLDDDEMRGVGITDLIGRTQRMSAVSESGLYHLVFQSRKPEARRFRKWVTMEVLPQIRRTGSFNIGAAPGADRVAGCGRSALGRLPIPRERSADLGEFYSELRKWVLKEDEAAVAELAGVSRGHVAEVLAGRKAGYGVLCLLVEYATENRAAGRQRMVRSAARRAEQVEELRLDFMCGVAPLRMGSTAREPQNRAGSHEADMRRVVPETKGPTGAADMRQTNPLRTGASAELRRDESVMRRDESVMRRDESRLYKGGGSLPETNGATGASPQVTGDAMNRVSTAKAQDVTDGVIDFNGMEG